MSLEGQQLGRYRLLKLIGSGGMGEVYLAQDPGINRQVAIKVVRVEAVDYTRTKVDTIPGMRAITGGGSMGLQDATRMFQREAKAIAMLDHPGILPLYDYGEYSANGTMLTYLVMPYREEGSLANWLQTGGFQLLSVQIVEQMLQQAASALQYSHDHQVVHQDVKPSNFLIRTSREHPKIPDLLLTDFGIAKLSIFTTRASQSIRGTPTYMAPEQWEGRPVPATDQYALAVMLYELLTGRPPFRGSPMQMMYAHVNAQPQAPSALNPRLSAVIDAVVLRGLAKKPEERFPSIIAFAFAFRQTLRSVDATTTLGISKADMYTLDRSPITLGNSGLNASATLAISEEEALNGTNRKIALPGGRQIRVRIPAGVKNGQVIRVLDQSDQAGASSTIKMYLTLSIVHSTVPAHLVAGESTSRSGDQHTPMRSGPVVSLNDERIATSSIGKALPGLEEVKEPQVQRTPLPANEMENSSKLRLQQSPHDPRGKISKPYLLLILLLVALLVISSAGFFYYLGGRHSTNITPATETASANMLHTATASARSEATASSRLHATEVAHTQKIATATAIGNGANPYPPFGGSLRLNDPMIDNNQGHHWQVFSDAASGNACQFLNGAYHLIDTPKSEGACFATATDFSSFAYQIEMTFIKAGQSFNGGGMIIRGSGNSYYYFEVFESGRFTFASCSATDCNHTLVDGLSQAIPSFHTGLNQTNTLAIVVNGFRFELFVNGVRVAGPVSDDTQASSHGMIGVYGAANDATTEIAYRNAKVWV